MGIARRVILEWDRGKVELVVKVDLKYTEFKKNFTNRLSFFGI